MIKITRFLIFIFLFNIPLSECGASESDLKSTPFVLRAIDLIFKEDFMGATATLDSLIKFKPANPAGYFYRGLIPWRQSGCVENYSDYDQEMQNWLEKTLEISENAINANQEDAEAYFYKGGAHGFLGSMYARQKNWLKTGYHAWKGIRTLERALQLNPQLYDVYYGFGLYHVMAGHQSGIVRFLQRLLPIPAGDPAKGLRALRTAIEKGYYSKIPACSALAFAYLYFEKDYQQAVNILKPLLEHYPDNTDLLVMMINSIFYRELSTPKNDWSRLLNFIDRLEKVIFKRKINLSQWWRQKLQFIRGYAYYYQNKNELAMPLLEAYTTFYSKNKSSYLTGLSELTLGKIYDLRGDRKQAVQKYQNALEQEDFGNVQMIARIHLKSPFTDETKSLQVSGTVSDFPHRP